MSFVWTLQDQVDSLLDFLGGLPQERAVRQTLFAVRDGLRDLSNAHNWRYYYRMGRLQTNAPYTTGTIDYDHTGGTYERQVTLTSGTWPSWAQYGILRVGSQNSLVKRRISNTVLQLDEQVNPGADIASGTEYSIFRSRYPLPVDFRKLDSTFASGNFLWGLQIPPQQLLWYELNGAGSGTPQYHSVFGDHNDLARSLIGFYPYPDTDAEVTFEYLRRPRALKYSGYDTAETSGTVFIPSGTTVAGTNTAFAADMVGSILRVSSSSTKPTGEYGSNPFVEQARIVEVTSSTLLTLEDPGFTGSYASKAYAITDPIDISEAMNEAFVLACQAKIAERRHLPDAERYQILYMDALGLARDGDQPSMQRRFCGDGGFFAHPEHYVPSGPEVA